MRSTEPARPVGPFEPGVQSNGQDQESVIAAPGRLLTAEDIAERWQVPKSQVYRLAREGRLAAVCIGRYRRWLPETVEAFEREGGADA